MKRNYKYNIGDIIECKDGSHNLIIDKIEFVSIDDKHYGEG